MPFRRILVAVDTTNGRDSAFERALSLARRSRAATLIVAGDKLETDSGFDACL